MTSMFGFHAIFALQILAAVAAAFLVVATADRARPIKTMGAWVGGLCLFFSAAGMACSTYYSIQYWQAGLYSPKAAASGHQMEQMMQMHGNMKGVPGPGDASEENHHPEPK